MWPIAWKKESLSVFNLLCKLLEPDENYRSAALNTLCMFCGFDTIDLHVLQGVPSVKIVLKREITNSGIDLPKETTPTVTPQEDATLEVNGEAGTLTELPVPEIRRSTRIRNEGKNMETEAEIDEENNCRGVFLMNLIQKTEVLLCSRIHNQESIDEEVSIVLLQTDSGICSPKGSRSQTPLRKKNPDYIQY
ncbi:unnamed protein product [Lepeophtheirus salmonis]|uniref:(salmon louse) hypothetical protein n=1 Tax=Lepeophtheirus salmonis TaxID=72036 RepID=A0A7R8CNB4_LEPSM|nr:unnamed protein product [Lepeophtheirus salmonis]CAF2828361.1 unnamed protein product [Lepeophtheirus salmonis]